MAGYIEINTDILNSDISVIEGHLNTIHEKLKGMYAQVEELNTMWKGQANAAFNSQFIQDYEYMESLLSNLDKYKNSMLEAKNKYVKCENSVHSMVNSLRI